MNEKGIEEIDRKSNFVVNEEVNELTKMPYFSISGTHIVTYAWHRIGPFSSREDAEKKIAELQ
jgi:hypothetical protein